MFGGTMLDRGEVDILIGFLPPKMLPDELLLIEWDGEGFVAIAGGNGSVSSIIVTGASSQIASTRAKL